MKNCILSALLAALSIQVGGCAVLDFDPPHAYAAPAVRVAPPAPRYEFVGSPPIVGQVWIGGNWNWVDTRYVWVPGRWETPRHGHVWTPSRWERHGDHWRHHGGRWEGRRDTAHSHWLGRDRDNDGRPDFRSGRRP